MGRNSLYSNSPYSSRMGGGWIYSDGELYHYGRKGMKWGKTIFGGYDNPRSFTYDPDRGILGNAKEWFSVAQDNVSGYGKHVKRNATREFRNSTKGARKAFNTSVRNFKDRNLTRQAFFDNRDDYNEYKKNNANFSNLRMTHLEAAMEKEYNDGFNAYVKMHNNRSLSNTINAIIQNAQYDVVSGVNKFLKKVGLDDEVDAIISKFRGDSKFRNWTSELGSGKNSYNSGGSNTGGGTSSKPGEYLEKQDTGNTNTNAAANKYNSQTEPGDSAIENYIIDILTSSGSTNVKPGDQLGQVDLYDVPVDKNGNPILKPKYL